MFRQCLELLDCKFVCDNVSLKLSVLWNIIIYSVTICFKILDRILGVNIVEILRPEYRLIFCY
jgi:hypothetical protein